MNHKKDLETNKIFASILVAGILAMLSGFVANIIYPDSTPTKNEVRGYKIEVVEKDDKAADATKVEEIIDVAALVAQGSLEKGKKLMSKCAACHNVEAGQPHKVGPNLHNVVNQKIASKDGYAYSSALTSIDKNWDYQELYGFLKSPRKYAKGTKMSFAGLRKPQDIADIILYLESKSN